MRTSIVTLRCINTLLTSSVKEDLHVLERSTSVLTFYIDQHHPLLSTLNSSNSSVQRSHSCKFGECYDLNLMFSQLSIDVPDLLQFITGFGDEANICDFCSNFKGLVYQVLFRTANSS